MLIGEEAEAAAVRAHAAFCRSFGVEGEPCVVEAWSVPLGWFVRLADATGTTWLIAVDDDGTVTINPV